MITGRGSGALNSCASPARSARLTLTQDEITPAPAMPSSAASTPRTPRHNFRPCPGTGGISPLPRRPRRPGGLRPCITAAPCSPYYDSLAAKVHGPCGARGWRRSAVCAGLSGGVYLWTGFTTNAGAVPPDAVRAGLCAGRACTTDFVDRVILEKLLELSSACDRLRQRDRDSMEVNRLFATAARTAAGACRPCGKGVCLPEGSCTCPKCGGESAAQATWNEWQLSVCPLCGYHSPCGGLLPACSSILDPGSFRELDAEPCRPAAPAAFPRLRCQAGKSRAKRPVWQMAQWSPPPGSMRKAAARSWWCWTAAFSWAA